MKIWLLNHYASMQYRDKSGRHYWFAKELKKRGYEPSVFCASTYHDSQDIIDTGTSKCLIKPDDDTGVPFVFVKTPVSVGNGIDRLKNMVAFYFNLFSSAKKYAEKYGKPDIILASSVHPLTLVAGLKIAKALHVPCICEIRDLWPEAIFSFGKAKKNSLLGRILIAGEHWIYRRANALIFTKEGDTDYLKEKGWTVEQGGDISLDKCYYINNGIDLEVYRKRIIKEILVDSDLQSADKFNVTYAGMIRPVNNVGMILECAKLLRHYTDIQFLIYGDGSELPFLQRYAEENHLTNVKIKGYVNRKYIPYVLSKSSVNILNYSQSQFNWKRGNSSNKLFEYMASGKPIISTVQMGYSIIKRYNCGCELNECTPQALAEAVLKIHTMPIEEYQSIGLNALIGAKDFDFSVLTDRLENIIKCIK